MRQRWLRVLFRRRMLTILLLLLQVYFLICLVLGGSQLSRNFSRLLTIVSIIAVLYIVSQKDKGAYKTAWAILILTFPLFGGLMYLLSNAQSSKWRFAKSVLHTQQKAKPLYALPGICYESATKQLPEYYPQIHYLQEYTGFPIYADTETHYLTPGERKLETLLAELEKAEKYIFLEYFIVDEGLMWGRILEVLARKAAQGVDVRVMYDGTCEFSTLPRNYPRLLEKLNIQCKVFSPVQPFVSTHYNYRDHRKILVIDGRVGFTGGVNLADEYINHIQKHGRWKDAAVMLEGEAVRSLTAQFLQMWGILKEPEYEQFLTRPIPVPENAKGVAAPYGDCPLDGERVGEMVYIDLLNRARDYIHIMTPYLILDGELETALKFAAERGVDVHLILPGKPDKQFPYALAKSHYSALLDSGVKISEWSPGFVHAKVFVVDGREAVVGTINLDYRSLYHHFEDAVWMVDAPCIRDIEQDFQHTLEQCRTVENTSASIWQKHYLLRATGMLLKVIAPLL